MNIFSDVFGKIDNAVQDIVAVGIANLMNTLEPLFLSGFTVYLLFVFISYWNSGFEESVVDFFKKTFAWFLILGFSLNVANYNEYVMPIVMGLGDGLSQALNGKTNADVLDGMTNNMIDIVVKNQDKANALHVTSVGRYIMIVVYNAIVIISFCTFLVISSSYILLAKIFMGILALIGPLFIALGLFPATRQYFTSWINQVFNYALLLLIMNITARLMIEIYGKVVDFSSIEYPTTNTFIVSIVLLSFMFFVVLLKIPDLASGLAGGISADGFGQAGRALKSITSQRQGKKSPKPSKDIDPDNEIKPKK